MRFVSRYLRQAFRDEGERLQVPEVWSPPPNANIYPTPEQVEEFAREVLAWEHMIAIDIESAGQFLICIGLTAINRETLAPGNTIVVRFRGQGAKLWGTPEDRRRNLVALLSLLENPEVIKVFQNGITFDVPELQDLGINIVGPYFDTMHMAHTAYPEMPKSLQFLSTLHLAMPVWKTLTSEDELEGKG